MTTTKNSITWRATRVLVKAGTFGTGTHRDSQDDVTVRSEIHYRAHLDGGTATPHILFYGALLEITRTEHWGKHLGWDNGIPTWMTTGRIWRG